MHSCKARSLIPKKTLLVILSSYKDLWENKWFANKYIAFGWWFSPSLMKKMVFKSVRWLRRYSFFLREDNTWEPEDNLDCPDLIAEYMQKHHKPTDKKESSGKRKGESDTDGGEDSRPKKRKDEVRGVRFCRTFIFYKILHDNISLSIFIFILDCVHTCTIFKHLKDTFRRFI